jgi:hypothetical protein
MIYRTLFSSKTFPCVKWKTFMMAAQTREQGESRVSEGGHRQYEPAALRFVDVKAAAPLGGVGAER